MTEMMMTTTMMSNKITLANEMKQTKEKEKKDYDDDEVKYIEDMYRYLSFFFCFFFLFCFNNYLKKLKENRHIHQKLLIGFYYIFRFNCLSK